MKNNNSYILDVSVNDNIFVDNIEYFFCFLSDRFELAANIWANELNKKFNKIFKPIWILSAKQNHFFNKENYIIINKKQKEIEQKLQKHNVIYLEDYEDINKEFSESQIIKDIIICKERSAVMVSQSIFYQSTLFKINFK